MACGDLPSSYMNTLIRAILPCPVTAARQRARCNGLLGVVTEVALRRGRPAFVHLEKLSHAYALLDLEPNALIETNRVLVRSAQLEIDLGGTQCSETRRSLSHERTADASPASIKSDGKMVDPASATVEPSEYCANDCGVADGD